MRKIGTSVHGLYAPMFREGDDLSNIVTNLVLNSGLEFRDKDVIAITESVVARVQGNYVTINEVAEEIRKITNNADVIKLYNPIFSRNRFAMILKAFARAAGKKVILYLATRDEVGNVCQEHPFTGLDYDIYYNDIVKAEGKECEIFLGTEYETVSKRDFSCNLDKNSKEYAFDVSCHGDFSDLAVICKDKCEYGLLGSNKASEELLKLFPNSKKAQVLVEDIQKRIKEITGKTVEVMVYGDGCFKDPVGGIWEFADPVVSPVYTSGLEGTPNEIKIKNFADQTYAELKGEELEEAIKTSVKFKGNNLIGNMTSQGTTPRRYTDLLGSLCDLTSGSGDKGTPIVVIQGYFDNYSNNV